MSGPEPDSSPAAASALSNGQALPDGVYDVMVIDVTPVARASQDQPDAEAGSCTLSLAISTGLAKGEVFDLAVHGIDIDPLELLGLPGTVEVREGTPVFRLG